MIRKLGLALLITLFAAITLVVFQSWRLAGWDLLPISIPLC